MICGLHSIPGPWSQAPHRGAPRGLGAGWGSGGVGDEGPLGPGLPSKVPPPQPQPQQHQAAWDSAQIPGAGLCPAGRPGRDSHSCCQPLCFPS